MLVRGCVSFPGTLYSNFEQSWKQYHILHRLGSVAYPSGDPANSDHTKGWYLDVEQAGYCYGNGYYALLSS
jgi:hypothetical protein